MTPGVRGSAETQRRPKALEALGLAGLGLLVAALGWESATGSVDFPIYHRVAQQLLSGDYELYPRGLYDGGPVESHGFRYAPAVAVLFVPFGLLPLQAAALAFFVLKIVAYAYIGLTVARYAGQPSRSAALMLASIAVVGGYLVEEFRFGNFHFFTVALMVLAFDGAERGRVALPAAALGIAIAAKLTPALLLAYFAFRRRVAVCAATIAALGVIWILPATVVGLEANNRLTEGFVKYAVQKIDEEDNYSLRGVLFKYLTPDRRRDLTYPDTSLADLPAATVSTIWILTTAAVGIGAAIALRRPPAGGRMVRLLELSLLLTVMLLASPHTQRRYFTALYVPALALLALLPGARSRGERPLVVVGLVSTAAASTVFPLLLGSRRLALAYEAVSPYFFATLALFVVLVMLIVRMKAEHTPGDSGTSNAGP